MPRRATLTYSSEDAPQLGGEELRVYYCKYSGKHALTTNCDLAKAPHRRADGATVIDTQVYTSKTYTTDGGVKVIKRRDGKLERQYRLNVGKLPVAYRTEPEGRLLYILNGALTAYSLDGPGSGERQVPVPPCILPQAGGTTQIALEVDDRAANCAIVKITSDYVRLQVTNAITHADATEELLEYVRSVLGVKMSQMSLLRGESTRHKLLLVENIPAETVFTKLRDTQAKERVAAGGTAGA